MLWGGVSQAKTTAPGGQTPWKDEWCQVQDNPETTQNGRKLHLTVRMVYSQGCNGVQIKKYTCCIIISYLQLRFYIGALHFVAKT